MHFKTKGNLYTARDIKREAKEQLSGYWGAAIIITLIPALFNSIFIQSSADGESAGIIVNLAHDFLVTGVTFSFMNVLRNRDYTIEPLREIFAPFRSEYFINLLKLHLWRYLFIILWSLLLIIPGIVKAYGYSQAELIYKDTVDRTGKQPDARACLKESEKRMYGFKADLFALDLSFLGWIFLNILTVGILSLWLTPYMEMSRVVFYENLTKGQYLEKKEEPHQMKESDDYEEPLNKHEEVGKNPDDFRDFDDF